jgi:hypothetical protein
MPATRRRRSAVTTRPGTRRRTGSDNALARRTGRDTGDSEVIQGNGREVLMRMLPNRPEYSKFRRKAGETLIHVSDLIYKCPRKVILAHLHTIALVEEPIFASLGLTFRQGEAIHDHVRDTIGRHHPEQIYARWKCKCNASSFVGTLAKSLKKPVCEKCGTKVDHHNELQVINESINVVGSPDLLLLKNSAFYINEIKSIAARYWDDLERPQPNHIIQVLFYWWLMREAGKKLHDHVSVLYVCKDFRPRTPYKEFTMNAPEILDRLEPYIAEARVIKEGIHNEGDLPERSVCATEDSSEAKKCEVCSLCFSMG